LHQRLQGLVSRAALPPLVLGAGGFRDEKSMIPTDLDTLLAIVNVGWHEFHRRREKRLMSAIKLPVDQLPSVADAIDCLFQAQGFPYPALDNNPYLHALAVLGTVLQGRADFETHTDLEPALEMATGFVLFTSTDRRDLDPSLESRFDDYCAALASLRGPLSEVALRPGISATWDPETMDWQFQVQAEAGSTTPRLPVPSSFGWLTDLDDFQERVLVPLLSKYAPAANSGEMSRQPELFVCGYCRCVCQTTGRHKDQNLCESCAADLRALQSEH
jgi:hypothetical protein